VLQERGEITLDDTKMSTIEQPSIVDDAIAKKKSTSQLTSYKQKMQLKKERDQAALMMHNRLLYLQNEELKKLKKLDFSRRKAQQFLENQIENRKIKIQLE